ncbi:unnamed protein product [Closterium sp. Yama58-4]|nr:unnamed protein product [Closterium sp. Yama58-4]
MTFRQSRMSFSCVLLLPCPHQRALPPEVSPDAGDSESSSGGSSADEGLGDSSLADLIDAALAAAHASCCTQMDRLRSQPDVEAVHDLRVAVRRLRATVSVFSPFIQVPDALRPRALGKLLRALGAVRDADVMLETLAAVQQRVSERGVEEARGEQRAVGRFEHAVRKRQRRLLRAALSATASKDAHHTMHALERCAQGVKPLSPAAAVLQQHVALSAPSLLTPHIAAALLNHAWSIDGLSLARAHTLLHLSLASLYATSHPALSLHLSRTHHLPCSQFSLRDLHIVFRPPPPSPRCSLLLQWPPDCGPAWVADLVTLELTPGAAQKQQQGTTSIGGSNGDGAGGGDSGGGGGERCTVVYRHDIMDHMHALRKLLRGKPSLHLCCLPSPFLPLASSRPSPSFIISSTPLL